MRAIVLISCVKSKLIHRARAKDLYTSTLFRYSLAYARSLKPDAIYILSAKYGLLELEQEIEPYEMTLKNMGVEEQREWANRVLKALRTKTNMQNDKFVILAGESYRRYLLPALPNHDIPMEGLTFGQQLSWLLQKAREPEADPQVEADADPDIETDAETEAVIDIKAINSNLCEELHHLLAGQPHYHFPFDPTLIPQNGIYVLFENDETAHGTDRIVRVGTHTGNNQLRSRLEQHFVQENKDRSIFRKNIGRALLNRVHDPFLEYWELDLTTHDAKQKYSHLVDKDKLKQTEQRVTAYMQAHFRFAVIPVPLKEDRMRMESRLISTVSRCDKCRPSSSWLGLHSPKARIRESGLWIVNELYKKPLNQSDFDDLVQRLAPRQKLNMVVNGLNNNLKEVKWRSN